MFCKKHFVINTGYCVYKGTRNSIITIKYFKSLKNYIKNCLIPLHHRNICKRKFQFIKVFYTIFRFLYTTELFSTSPGLSYPPLTSAWSSLLTSGSDTEHGSSGSCWWRRGNTKTRCRCSKGGSGGCEGGSS